MMKDTPTAVISGASRGAVRSLRYATRSISIPVRPAAIIVSGMRMASAPKNPSGPLVASELRLKPKG